MDATLGDPGTNVLLFNKMRSLIYYLAFLLFIAIAAVVFSARDAATRPQEPWIVTAIDKPVGEEPGYLPEDAEPEPMLYAIECTRGDSFIHLTYYGYPPPEFAVGMAVYIKSGLRRSNRDEVGWPLNRVNYSLTQNHDQYHQNNAMRRSGGSANSNGWSGVAAR